MSWKTNETITEPMLNGFSLDLPSIYNQNTKLISDCESVWSAGAWTSTIGTAALSTENFKVGSYSALCGASVSSAGIYKSTTLNLATFNSGEASSTNDYIQFCLNIASTTEYDKMHSDGLRLEFPCDSTGTLTNYMYKVIAKSDLTSGWNFKQIRKSDFTIVSTGAWADVKGIVIKHISAPASSMNLEIDAIDLVRTDPSSTEGNQFQRKINNSWTRDFAINDGHWFVGLDGGSLVCRNLNPGTSNNALQSLLEFSGSWDIIGNFTVKTADYCYGVGWYLDASNMIKCYISADTLYLEKVEATTSTTVSVALDIAVGDTIEFKLNREGTTISVDAILNGGYNSPYHLTQETALSISTVGYPIVIGYAAKEVNLNNFAVNKWGGYVEAAKRAITGPTSSIGFWYLLHEVFGAGNEITRNNTHSDDGSWLTVGPTGSGANIIWDELDNIPVNAKAVLISFDATLKNGGTGTSSIAVRVRKNGGIYTNPSYQCSASGYVASEYDTSGKTIIVSLNNRIFDLYWYKVGSFTGSWAAYLDGYSL